MGYVGVGIRTVFAGDDCIVVFGLYVAGGASPSPTGWIYDTRQSTRV